MYMICTHAYMYAPSTSNFNMKILSKITILRKHLILLQSTGFKEIWL